MKRIIYFLIASCFNTAFSLHNGFYDCIVDNACVAKVFINTKQAGDDLDDMNSFVAAMTDLPEVLSSLDNTTHLFIFVPPVFDNVSSIDEQAPLLEGARVALAWASAFFRFDKHSQITIMELPSRSFALTEDYVKAAIYQARDRHINFEANPEKAMQQSIVHLSEGIIKIMLPHYLLVPVACKQTIEEHVLLHHNLPRLEAGQKRIVITGAAGFLGSHLSRKLLEEGHQVIALDNLICSSGENLQDLYTHKNFCFIKHDVTRSFDIDGTIDVIAHLASIPSPAFYYAMPIETLCSGLYGTQATVELAVRKNARYLFSSTSEVYGDPEVTPQPETYCGRVSPIGKRSQYDESKRGAETLLSLYYKKYGLDIRVARLFNTYGPGMDLADGRVVTNFIQAVLDQKPMIVHGDGSQTRSFAHVSDTVQGLYSLLMTDLFTDNSSFNDRIVNIGNDGEFTVNELAQKVNELAQKNSCRGVPVVHVDPIDMTDPKKRRPDLTKARFLLHYNPYTGLDEGLEKTFSYFEARRKGK